MATIVNACDSALSNRGKIIFDNGCFLMIKKDETLASFCALKNFGFPADGVSTILKTVCFGEDVVLFDNEINELSPSSELNPDHNYVRGIMLSIQYPKYDKSGEEILLKDQNARIIIGKTDGSECNLPVHTFFSIFTNPETINSDYLINKINVSNPNTEYAFNINAFLVYTKANGDYETGKINC